MIWAKIKSFFDGKDRCENCGSADKPRQVADKRKASLCGYNLNLMILCSDCLKERNLKETHDATHRATHQRTGH